VGREGRKIATKTAPTKSTPSPTRQPARGRLLDERVLRRALSVTTSVVVVANLEDGGSMTEGTYRLECLEPNVKGRRTLRG
jgi:hypothetical protein